MITHRFTPKSKDVLLSWYPRTKLEMKPKREPGQRDVVLYLASHDYSPGKAGGSVIWERPRFVAAPVESVS